ncbi:periplasmic component of amino acid ABC-type transporter/signal transduction system [Mycobacterium sp. JS623]|uniref:transporter substrate-binding domain-containing protein n=1 Tax=Mycobacterium sp. JS623 TaxID=212767 RepID=UPI0002A56079|nr:transporter substrate-binding domain-containing protein [Mycobacterium sp. JS623]AGB24985.1 periplasmic component of amino acid ABC-type transporter/signal transduction system [Mycobacterium sp. JS623]
MTAIRSAALTVLIALLTSCGSTATPPTTMQRAGGLPGIAQRGAVRVCSTGDYRPFTYHDPQGNWSGLDIEMAHDMADRLAARLDVVPTTWANLITDLNNKCDVAMGGISITLNRAKQALYSAPYLRDGKAAIVRCADAANYQTLDDIDRPGVRVVVNPGGTNADFDKDHLRNAQVVTYPDNNTIFEQLTNNAADVMITDASEIRWEENQEPQLCGVSLDHPFTFEQKGYLVAQSATDLQQWIDQWLNIAQNDGTYAALSRKYLGAVIGP